MSCLALTETALTDRMTHSRKTLRAKKIQSKDHDGWQLHRLPLRWPIQALTGVCSSTIWLRHIQESFPTTERVALVAGDLAD